MPALYPKEDSHDSEVGSEDHGARQVCPNTHKTIPLHQEVEEEALVQVLKQVVQTPKGAFNHSAHGHLIMPSFAVGLQGHRINMVGNKAAVRTSGVSQPLLHHPAGDGSQTVHVASVVVAHVLDECVNSHLIAGDVRNGVDQVEVRQLAIYAIVNDVHGLKAVLQGVVKSQSTLQSARFQG